MSLLLARSRFARIAAEHSKALHRYAFWLCSDHSDAEDHVQEALARAWKSFDSLKEEQAAKSWLYTILRRELLRHAAKGSKGRLVPLDTEIENTLVAYNAGQGTHDIREALRRLPPDYREPLLLQVSDGFSLLEIGLILDLPVNTVATRVHRARLKLRDMLAGPTVKNSAEGGRT